MATTNLPPSLTPNYPCLICNSPQISNYFPEKSTKKSRKSKNKTPSLKNFLLTTLLEIPSLSLNSADFGDDTWLNICEPCLIAVQQAEQIHTELQVATQKYRNCQESIITSLKKSLITQPIKEEPNNPYQLCRQFANHHTFNSFGYPFIVNDPNNPSPPPKQTTPQKRPPPPPPPIPQQIPPPPPKKISKISKAPPPPSTPQKIQMTRALFLNVAAVTDLLSASGVFSKSLAPFILIGHVSPEELPPPFDFTKTLLTLIGNRKVDFQKKKRDNLEDRVLLGSKIVWNPDTDGDPPEGRIYYMSDLSKKEEMAIVGPSYQIWKEVGGVLSYLHPGLNCIANVGFIFSERKTCLGLHMEDLRFSSVNILFQGRKQWDIVHPEDNENLIKYLKESHKGEELGEEDGCDWWVLHKNIWIGEETRGLFRVSTVVQERGDVVMVPPGVLHQVRNLEDCVAASYNFVDGMWVQEKGVFEGCSCGHKGGRTVLGVGEVNRLKEAHFQVNLYARYEASGGAWWGPEHKFYGAKATAEFFDGVGEEEIEEEVEEIKVEGGEGDLKVEGVEGDVKVEGVEEEKVEEGEKRVEGENRVEVEKGAEGVVNGVEMEEGLLDLRVGVKIESEPVAQPASEEKMVVNE